MPKTKTLNCHLAADRCEYGCAAAIASNDPAVYPENGLGVELSTYSSDTGCMTDVAGSLLGTFVERAVEDGVSSVLVFSDVPLYQGAVNRETVCGCTVDVIWVPSDAPLPGSDADPRAIRRRMALDAVARQLEKLGANAGLITFDDPPLIPGQYVIHEDGSRRVLGRVRSVAGGTALVWYGPGAGASETPVGSLSVLDNAASIIETDLGGADALARFPQDANGGRT